MKTLDDLVLKNSSWSEFLWTECSSPQEISAHCELDLSGHGSTGPSLPDECLHSQVPCGYPFPCLPGSSAQGGSGHSK